MFCIAVHYFLSWNWREKNASFHLDTTLLFELIFYAMMVKKKAN